MWLDGQAMSKKSPFHPIGNILGSLMKGRQWNIKLNQYALFNQWENLVGTEIAKQATPKVWRGKTLVVAVTSSAWLQELKMMEEDILKKICQNNPEIKIEKIQWVLR